MSTNKTEHLELHTWEPFDAFTRGEFNENFEKLDAAVGLDRQKNEAAQKSTVAAITAITANLGSHGYNLRVSTGSYNGNDKFGASNPTRLTFDFCPVCLILMESGSRSDATPLIMCRGVDQAIVLFDNYLRLTVTWENKAVKWWHASYAGAQFNRNSFKYSYVALGYDP